MTSVRQRHSCWSVTPKPRHVLHMEGLRGRVTLIPIGAKQREVSDLERQEGAYTFIIRE